MVRRSRSTRRESTCAQGEHAEGFELETLLLEATVLTTTPPYSIEFSSVDLFSASSQQTTSGHYTSPVYVQLNTIQTIPTVCSEMGEKYLNILLLLFGNKLQNNLNLKELVSLKQS